MRGNSLGKDRERETKNSRLCLKAKNWRLVFLHEAVTERDSISFLHSLFLLLGQNSSQKQPNGSWLQRDLYPSYKLVSICMEGMVVSMVTEPCVGGLLTWPRLALEVGMTLQVHP